MKAPLIFIILGSGFLALTAERKDVSSDSVFRGQQVYIAEGCINCHSQYSRPYSKDEINAGPSSNHQSFENKAVLIGNRRQGPDLSNIGARRSREWNRAHLIDPQSISTQSRMPSYSHLFQSGSDKKGEDLLDYIESLITEDPASWWDTIYHWSPEKSNPGNRPTGKKLFQDNCAQCHGTNGDGNGAVGLHFKIKPLNLISANYRFAPRTMDPEIRKSRIAQIIKYGQAGTSMPGHEYLTDQNVIDLMDCLNALSEQN
jgi:hypothetical protein